jgi:hypothetical protein
MYMNTSIKIRSMADKHYRCKTIDEASKTLSDDIFPFLLYFRASKAIPKLVHNKGHAGIIRITRDISLSTWGVLSHSSRKGPTVRSTA